MGSNPTVSAMTVREIKAKSILQKSGLPDVDWVINPYGGSNLLASIAMPLLLPAYVIPMINGEVMLMLKSMLQNF